MNLPARNCRMTRVLWVGCIIWVKQPRFILPLLSSLLTHFTKYTTKNLVNLQIDRLAVGKNSVWTMHVPSKNVINKTLTYIFDGLVFLDPCDVRYSTGSCFWVIPKNPYLIISDNFTKCCLVCSGSRIYHLHLCRGVRPPPMSFLDMVLNNLMVRFQWCRSFGECGAPFPCHRSQVHSGLK